MIYKFSNIHKKGRVLFASVHVDYDKVPDFIIGIADNDKLKVNTRILLDEFSIAAHAKLALKRRECGENNMPESFSAECNLETAVREMEKASTV